MPALCTYLPSPTVPSSRTGAQVLPSFSCQDGVASCGGAHLWSLATVHEDCPPPGSLGVEPLTEVYSCMKPRTASKANHTKNEKMPEPQPPKDSPVTSKNVAN